MALYRSAFSVFIPTPDVDAASYISRVGITDLQGQIDIHNFVKELKNAGVYSLLTSIYQTEKKFCWKKYVCKS